MPEQRTELSWSGWGDPAQAIALPDSVLALLRDGLGVGPPNRPASSLTELELGPVRLPERVSTELRELVGGRHAHAGHEARARRALGRSTLDLLTLRAGETLPAPDLVLTPGSHDEILAVLAVCSRERVAVVPFGGGTSVVGGLTPEADAFTGTVVLDLQRLNQLGRLDEESRLVRLGPGLRGPEAEALLNDRGYTLGHFPQSFEYATLGGFAAARSSGQASPGYGRFDEMVLGLRAATPMGTLELGRAPKSAAGPDLRQLILGSEGAFGVMTELLVQIRRRPEEHRYDGWRFPDFSSGAGALRSLVQDGPVPTILRLSDESETAIGLAEPEQLGGEAGETGCLAIVGYEGASAEVAARQDAVSSHLREVGAEPVPAAGENWRRGRFRAPYLRDALLDAGALVETLETAGFWSHLPQLYAAVGEAIRASLSAQGTPPLVLAHISHVYPSGASLYFTVACAQSDDPRRQWREAKRAASEAIVATGGSISHHHGVGRDHREWLVDEIGELGCAALVAVKGRLDPAGILNPGVLLPSEP